MQFASLYLSQCKCVEFYAENSILQHGMSKHNVLRHMLRLLHYIHPKIPQEKLESLLQALKPSKGVSQSQKIISLSALCKNFMVFTCCERSDFPYQI